jgi:hypothetical protein
MSRLRVTPIVEGKGEVGSIRILLERLWLFLGGESINVLRPPIRRPRGRLVKRDGLQDAARLAVKELRNVPAPEDPGLVLILLDADDDRPCELGPRLLGFAREVDPRVDVICVVANVEYETWFAATADSLARYLDVGAHSPPSEDPEGSRHGKAWVKQRFRGTSYSETQDQPRLTSAMDLGLCRRRSPSFDKLCRELEQRLHRQSTEVG